MPNRIVREGFIRSKRVDALDLAAEVFFHRLMLVVDDHGRYEAAPCLLRAACYPRRTDQITDSQVAKWCEECQIQSLIHMYSVTGTDYIQIENFHQRTRSRSKYPDPPPDDGHDDGHTADKCPRDDGLVGVGSVCGGVAEAEGEGELPPSYSPPHPSPTEPPLDWDAEQARLEVLSKQTDAEFDTSEGWKEFAKMYPNKRNVEAACRFYLSEMGKRSPPKQGKLQIAIMDGLNRYLVSAAWCNRDTGQLEPEFVPAMDRFLGCPKNGDPSRGKLYPDHPAPWKPRANPKDKGARLREKSKGKA